LPLHFGEFSVFQDSRLQNTSLPTFSFISFAIYLP
jgi:hypothetical protein